MAQTTGIVLNNEYVEYLKDIKKLQNKLKMYYIHNKNTLLIYSGWSLQSSIFPSSCAESHDHREKKTHAVPCPIQGHLTCNISNYRFKIFEYFSLSECFQTHADFLSYVTWKRLFSLCAIASCHAPIIPRYYTTTPLRGKWKITRLEAPRTEERGFIFA